MKNMTKLERGTQIAYVPIQAKGDLNHRDVEFGFVTSGYDLGGYYFCRFYYKNGNLRTTARSEPVSCQHLVVHKSRSQTQVEKDLLKYC